MTPSFARFIDLFSTDGLESLTVNGEALSEAVLNSKQYKTPALVAELENVQGKGNAAVTILPPYNGVVRLILEAEDHSARSVFEIMLDADVPPSPETRALVTVEGIANYSGQLGRTFSIQKPPKKLTAVFVQTMT